MFTLKASKITRLDSSFVPESFAYNQESDEWLFEIQKTDQSTLLDKPDG